MSLLSELCGFATRSHQRAAEAHAEGLFAAELAPVRTDAGLVTAAGARYALQTMCEAGGLAHATGLEGL